MAEIQANLDKYESKLRKALKDLSRKQKGSNNWEKQNMKVARINRKIRNVRKDQMYKSRILAAQNTGRK